MSKNTNINTVLLPLGVVQSNGSGLLTSSTGLNGQTLIGSTGSSPVWSNVTSTGGSINITNGPNTIDLTTAAPFPMAGAYAFMYRGPTGIPVGTTYFYGTTPPISGPPTSLIVPYDATGTFYGGLNSANPAKFTAASSGYYYLNYQVNIGHTTGGPLEIAEYLSSIVTSNRTYEFNEKYQLPASTLNTNCCLSMVVVADLDIGDTVMWSIKLVSSTLYPSYQLQTYPTPNPPGGGNLAGNFMGVSGVI